MLTHCSAEHRSSADHAEILSQSHIQICSSTFVLVIAGQNTNNKIMTDCMAGYCLLKHFGSARLCYKNPHRLYSILSSNNTCNG